MSKKKINGLGGLVYSTDPDFKIEEEHTETGETLSPKEQKLRIRLDTKRRAGRAVTLIQDFIGRKDDLERLGKQLKNFCGTGGSVKEGEIIIQGDNRDKVLQWLIKNGFSNTKRN
jgi:translation initiation factor 1